MIVYAESSAVLSWILGESGGEAVRGCLESAEFVVTSELTLVECDRMFHRARILEELAPERIEAHRSVLLGAMADWVFLRLDREIIEQAREPLPEDPVRSLDALHLASVLATVRLIPETSLLTLDERVRRCGRALGLAVLPS
ncbi:MAG: type II toxin-antitoxin system VapC family toxin [bacterium]|nr:type II toxin-antitoxin system VapC family toxin [bacterium]